MIDPVSNVIFVVTETGPPINHALIGLDATTGSPRVLAQGDPWPVIPATHQQRAALTLANGRVYWAYGGLAGDCSDYHGTVLSVRTDGTDPLEYVVPTHNHGAIWAPSGPAVDDAGNIWVASGNGDSATTFDHGNSLIKLSPTLQELGYFVLSNWAACSTSTISTSDRPDRWCCRAASSSRLARAARRTGIGLPRPAASADKSPRYRSGATCRGGERVLQPRRDLCPLPQRHHRDRGGPGTVAQGVVGGTG